MDAVTYPEPAVYNFITEHFVPLRLNLDRRADQLHFRAYQVIWTPTIGMLDRRGTQHYQSPGFLPLAQFLALLQIGLARSLLAWGQYDAAAVHLTNVADNPASKLADEALYWLGTAYYLRERRRSALMRAWRRLREEYPSSIWTLRIPPNQEDEPDLAGAGSPTRI